MNFAVWAARVAGSKEKILNFDKVGSLYFHVKNISKIRDSARCSVRTTQNVD